MTEKKAQICRLLEQKQEDLYHISDLVWDYAEIGFAEFKSAQIITEVLEKEGFRVEKGLSGMETAFRGAYGSGHPVIGFLGEYDALAGVSQKSMSTKREPEKEGAPGHGCGHNLLGVGALGAAIALKDYLAENKLEGTVVYLGCPAEETGAGKVFMARDGVFNDLDIALTWHPGTMNSVVTNSSLADCMMVFRFQGVTAHAAAQPHLGRSALDAAELFNVGVQFLREHIEDSARIHYAFLDVGGTAPNVVQDRAALYYDVRAPRNAQVRDLCPRVTRIAEGAAMMTDTSVSVEIMSAMSDYVPNFTLSKLMADANLELGGICFSPEAQAFAAEISKQLNPADIAYSAQSLAAYYDQEKCGMLANQTLLSEPFPYIESRTCMPGSTDVGDVSYVVPTAQCSIATAAFGTQPHSWQQTAQGKSPIAHEGMLYAAKVMGFTAVKVLSDPALLKKIKDEHKRSVGEYICPIPNDLEPKIAQ